MCHYIICVWMPPQGLNLYLTLTAKYKQIMQSNRRVSTYLCINVFADLHLKMQASEMHTNGYYSGDWFRIRCETQNTFEKR